jgi:hypothetical protein
VTKRNIRRAAREDPAMPLLAGFDSINYSSQARIAAPIRAKLEEDKLAAQLAAREGAAHCPEWLGARVLPNGAKGYSTLIETENFTVKVAGEHMTSWPGLYCELRSHFLHTHPGGARGAVEASLAWIREHLLTGEVERSVRALCAFETVTPSRFDLHVDWQGGFAPTFDAGEVERFVKPRRLKWHPYFEGTRCTGYRFGSGGPLLARLYNKTAERKTRQDDVYFALVAARNPGIFDPERDVWRLEFQIRREGMTAFRLAPATGNDDTADLDAQIESELSAEDVPHLATFPKLFAHRAQLFDHLMTHWLRLTQPSTGQVRSRWPTDPTWEALRQDFGRLADASPLDEDARALVRSKRYEGRRRLLRRMTLGVVKALEVQDASVASASLAQLAQLAHLVASHEAERLEARKLAAATLDDVVSPWVESGMGAIVDRPSKARHLIQMLLGIFAAHGVLALDFKPAHSVGDLLVQHLDALEAEADEKGGLDQLLAEHFAKVYKRALPAELVEALS